MNMKVSLSILLFFVTILARAQGTEAKPDHHEDLLVEVFENGEVKTQFPVHAKVRESDGKKEVTFSESTEPVPSKKFRIDLDLGITNILKNDVRIPNEGGTLFSLRTTQFAPSIRAYFAWAINSHHSIRLLYAPLSVTTTIVPDEDIVFNGLTYLAGAPVEAYYQFNSYRIGYIYTFDRVGNAVFRLGFTNKIRDARIGLGPNSGSTGNGFNDLGYVPLLHFGANYTYLKDRAFADIELEGLAVPGAPGRAIEITAQTGIRFNERWGTAVGYRFLEGGADVNIYNFAFVQSFFARITFQF
jgi:hypothetical protein